MKRQSILVLVTVCAMAVTNTASADMIRGIDMNFVAIGNAGNAADTQVMLDGTATGYGAVDHNYSIGKYEVTNAQWNTFTAAVGAPTGNPSHAYDETAFFTGTQQPTNRVTWYEASQFCNYLTTGDKSLGAYLFSGNNANPGDFLGIDRASAEAIYGTIYVLPTEDEWYKAAYYTGSGYSLYANGLNTLPPADNGWNYLGGTSGPPWDVGSGTAEQNGTFDMMGNVWEWNETAIRWFRGVRGGSYGAGDAIYLSSSFYYGDILPATEYASTGFRIATNNVVPVPGAFLLGTLGLGMAGWKLRRRRTS